MSDMFRMMIIGKGICNRCKGKGNDELSEDEVMMVGINRNHCLTSSIADEFKTETIECYECGKCSEDKEDVVSYIREKSHLYSCF